MKHNTLMFLFFIMTEVVLWDGFALAEDLNLTGPISGVYYTDGKITAQGTCNVGPGVTATCAATQGIALNPGFHAQAGSAFRAIIDTGTDSDHDGLTDVVESYIYHTNPSDPDSDGDGMPDGYEVRYGLNPLVDDADNDNDGDNLTNFMEFQLGSDPLDHGDPPSGNYYEYDELGRIKKTIRKQN